MSKSDYYNKSGYWNSLHDYMNSRLKYDPNQIIFRELFEKYVKKGGTCFEVGCYPGNFLIYFAKEFGYKVSGIDMAARLLDVTPAYLQTNGVVPEEITRADFTHREHPKLYDLVCSFGFVEHFVNYEEIIVKHISLVKPGGTLVMSCPNLRNLQLLVYWLTDRETLSAHVVASMNLRKWKKILDLNGMRLLYHNYYGTAGFVGAPKGPSSKYKKVVQELYSRFCDKVDNHFDYPNAVLSPHLLSISEKK